MKKIILASGSPRRKELLEELHLEFRVAPKFGCDESYDPQLPPEKVPQYLSQKKSRAYGGVIAEDEVLLTADTIVIIDNKILEKPVDAANAIEMLESLSGRTHKVVTAMTLRNNSTMESLSVETLVSFRELSHSEIVWYVDNFKPYDKAGAYGAQEYMGTAAISKLEGSYHNVVGLPTAQLLEMLASGKW